MTIADAHASEPIAAKPVGVVPRHYNFAADLLQSNLAQGRADKPAYIDARGATTYGQLARGGNPESLYLGFNLARKFF